jgi:hypothetical protein
LDGEDQDVALISSSDLLVYKNNGTELCSSYYYGNWRNSYQWRLALVDVDGDSDGDVVYKYNYGWYHEKITDRIIVQFFHITFQLVKCMEARRLVIFVIRKQDLIFSHGLTVYANVITTNSEPVATTRLFLTSYRCFRYVTYHAISDGDSNDTKLKVEYPMIMARPGMIRFGVCDPECRFRFERCQWLPGRYQ